MVTTPRKPRIIRETVKDMHTSHWDQDMLSHAELDALLGARNSEKNGADAASAAELEANPTCAAKVSSTGKEADPT